MSQATFTILIDGIKTTTSNNLIDVVKEVMWTLKGEESNTSFQLPQTTILPNPEANTFIQFANLTSEIVGSWIETTDPSFDSIKAHVQYVLDQQVVSAALTPTPLPWASANTPNPV
jgi:hypothetical protein